MARGCTLMWVRIRVSGLFVASECGGTSANIIWFFWMILR